MASLSGVSGLSGLSGVMGGVLAVVPPVAANLALWVRSDTGLLQSSGGSAATATNDPVGEWQDQSGNGRHLIEATNKPTLQLAAVNGHAGIRFDGTNDTLKALFALDRPFHVFLVVKQITWTNADNLLAGGALDRYSLKQAGSSPQIDVWNGAASAGTNGNLAVGAWGIIENLMAAASPRLRVNDTAATTPGVATSSDRGGITMGAHPNPTSFANIEVAELLVYSAEQTGADLTAVRSYLGTRYGIAV